MGMDEILKLFFCPADHYSRRASVTYIHILTARKFICKCYLHSDATHHFSTVAKMLARIELHYFDFMF